MTIDRIGSVDPLQNGKKPDRAGAVRQNSEPDAVSLSTEAVEKGELYRAIELASAAADLRSDRIAELKQRINDPAYLNDTVIKTTADRILDAFGL
jgi:negative regulator of flagellin synthesis FlgM